MAIGSKVNHLQLFQVSIVLDPSPLWQSVDRHNCSKFQRYHLSVMRLPVRSTVKFNQSALRVTLS